MPTFFTSTADHQPIPDGTYVLKILTAVERISERGNEMLVMKLDLPDGRRTTREAAILKNPSIAEIQLQPQPTVPLPAVRKP